MQYVLAVFLTITPALLAWSGYQTGNDMLLILGCLVALAPATALVALKLKWL